MPMRGLLPPAEFTRARDERANARGQSGARAAADAGQALRKPPVAAGGRNHLAPLIAGHPVPDALRRANATAALACRALDGRGAIPTRPELDAFLANAASPIPATGDPR